MNDKNKLSSSTYQKKAVHSILASRLTQLHIPSAVDDPSQEFDFADFFGPAASSSPPSSSSLFLGDPQVIHHRTHSFVGPSPRLTLSKSIPGLEEDERDDLSYSSSDDTGGINEVDEAGKNDGGRVCGGGSGGDVDGVENGGEEDVKKVGPGDFEIMRMIGKGAFGKVFQVRMRSTGDGNGDGIFAMKVMRKDTIIKNNHVDYMKAERNILTKVVHPFIVPLRYSFQVILLFSCY